MCFDEAKHHCIFCPNMETEFSKKIGAKLTSERLLMISIVAKAPQTYKPGLGKVLAKKRMSKVFLTVL